MSKFLKFPSFLLVVLLTIWSHPINGTVLSRKARLVGGLSNANWTEFNFIVALAFENRPGRFSQYCAGSLVTPKIAVTAAHCLLIGTAQPLPLQRIRVVGGNAQWQYAAQTRRVAAAIPHRNFIHEAKEHDIAVLVLDKAFDIQDGTIGSVGLSRRSLPTWERCTVAGWGRDEANQSPPTLMWNNFHIYPKMACQFRFVLENVDHSVCALNMNYTSSVCSGDSGGPLVCQGKLAGIVSSSGINCTTQLPSVFVDVRYYADWIDEQVKNTMSKTVSSWCAIFGFGCVLVL